MVALLVGAACEDAVIDCPPQRQLGAEGALFCVFPGDPRPPGFECPDSIPHATDVEDGFVCSSRPHESHELPAEVCRRFVSGCGAAPDASSGDTDAPIEDAMVAPDDARPDSEAMRDAGVAPEAGAMDGAMDATADAARDAGADARPDDAARDGGAFDAGGCPGARVLDVAVGTAHACAVAEGRLYCWGSNVYGQAGDPSGVGAVSAPRRVGTATDWARVSAGEQHSCAVKAGGTLWCWGAGRRDSRLGFPPADNLPDPTRVDDRNDWASVSAGYTHTCAITDDDALHCWGANDYGQLGTGTNDPVTGTSGPAIGPGIVWRAVDSGRSHTCARASGDSVYCWGRNGSGELGNGSRGVDAGTNAPGMAIGGLDWAEVELGDSYTCARERDGSLFCWGSGSDGRLALGTDMADRALPAESTAIATPAMRGLAVGYRHACVLDGTGLLRCFGNDDHGEIGTGRGTPSFMTFPVPTAVAGSRSYDDVVAGEHATCALEGGALYCWGEVQGVPIAGEGADRTTPTRICLPAS